MPANNSSEMALCDDEQVGVDLRRLHPDALALLSLCWVPDWVVSTSNSPVMVNNTSRRPWKRPAMSGVWVVLSVSCLQRLGRVIPSAMCRPGRKAPDADEVAAVTPTQHTRTHPAL